MMKGKMLITHCIDYSSSHSTSKGFLVEDEKVMDEIIKILKVNGVNPV